MIASQTKMDSEKDAAPSQGNIETQVSGKDTIVTLGGFKIKK